jgi:hypothetical protein
VANLDFWSDEVAHCLSVIDQYHSRFDRLAAAQKSYVAAHGTIEFVPGDRYGDTAEPPRRPRRTSDADRSTARRELCEAFYQFVILCHAAGLIDASTVRSQCQRHKISIDPADLRRRT